MMNPAITKTLLSGALLLAVCNAPAQNIPNPVLPGVADAGVVKFNGKYYIGGVRTDGDFYYSSDLVKWEGPVHVLDMDNEWTRGTRAGNNQIHANHMIYIDGTFHLYWSVNHWGDDKHIVHVAHAEADDILGPYVEPVRDTWMDNRIDPMVFRDDDGKLYMYMVRFTDGNTIWARPMTDPRTFAGPVIYQYASLPGTWERMDNRVIEGPWVIKYRDRYYMMFNGNHTGTDWGNYQLGVAEADTPVTFNNGTKYPYPLLLSNQTPLEEEYANLLMFDGNDYDPIFSYTTEEPSGKWQSAGYDDSSWARGRGAFASRYVEGSTVRRQGTAWDSQNIRIRKSFSVTGNEVGNLALRVHHDAPAGVYLNGETIYESQEPDYRMINLTGEQRKLLKDGANILAAESERGRRGGFLDVALFDMKESAADDILYSPGQPNIVRGTNGFEWWLVYMANKNREQRSQYINRIYFFDRTMYADNVTSTATKGYFPKPSKPTFGDLFDDDERLDAWRFSGARWSVSDGTMHSPNGASAAVLEDAPASSQYLFEAGVDSSSDAGVIAWWSGESDWLRVGLDPTEGKWYTERSRDGKISKEFYPLVPGFKFGVFHTLTVERNGDRITVRIDDMTRTSRPLVVEGLEGAGRPGLFAEGDARFDGITYTRGWDEFDGGIAGWGDSPRGEKAAGDHRISEAGLEVLSEAPFRAFKGDGLTDYEYSLQVSATAHKGTAGMYAAWVDEKNHVAVAVDHASGRLETKIVRDGRTVARNSFPLGMLRTLYADMRFTDSMDKGYTFTSPTRIESLWLDRVAVDNDFYRTAPKAGDYGKVLFHDNIFEKMNVEYLQGGKWRRFTGVKSEVAPNPTYNRMTFDPVEAEALRFINSDPGDGRSHIYKIRVGELSKESYNLRAVKRAGEIIVMVDGREMCRLEGAAEEEARVGIFSEGCTPLFNGITRYDISQND
jgi:GH43 family beta-xylosidase